MASQGFWRRGRGRGRGPRGERGGQRGWTGDQQWRSLSVCLSVVCPLLDKLVQAALADCDKTFGGGQGHGQECLYSELNQSVKVRARKGQEIQI